MKPTRRTVLLMSAFLLFALVSSFSTRLGVIWEYVGYLYAAVLLWDFIALIRLQPFIVRHLVNTNLPITAWSGVTLKIRNPNDVDLTIDIFDYTP